MARKSERYAFSEFFSKSAEFDPDNDPVDLALIEPLAPVIELLGRWFRPEYHGLDRIPLQGGALIVGNHGIIGFDPFFLFVAIYRATGRLPRGLGDRHLFMDPISRKFWRAIGALDGTPEVALRFLRAGHLVSVYPGGAREAFKSADQRYQLLWQHSDGFVKLAMRAEVPVILQMSIGIDDTYKVLGKVDAIGRLLGHAKYAMPIWLGWGPLPRPVKFDYYISEPITLEGDAAAADDPVIVARNHEHLWKLGHEMLADGLRRRAAEG
jgi:1-acyl-sn-glycerol-3-phosphate acyltransferase